MNDNEIYAWYEDLFEMSENQLVVRIVRKYLNGADVFSENIDSAISTKIHLYGVFEGKLHRLEFELFDKPSLVPQGDIHLSISKLESKDLRLERGLWEAYGWLTDDISLATMTMMGTIVKPRSIAINSYGLVCVFYSLQGKLSSEEKSPTKALFGNRFGAFLAQRRQELRRAELAFRF